MVKKKVSGKTKKRFVKKTAPKKKISRTKKVSEKSSISRKDFDTFKFGVERLKELRKELDSLDAQGFRREEQTIRSKLKNVSEIPNIERDIKILKLKIRKKYRPRKKVSRTKLIRKDIQDLEGKFPEIKKQIKKLGEKVEKEKKKKVKMDSEVEILVDTNFNDFLGEVKNSLSARVRNKEKEIADVLKIDLQKRENNFREKHLNLIRNFNDKKRKLEQESEARYSKKVKTSLQKEISEKFNFELQRKLNSEKVKLGKKYIAELREHAKINLEKQKQKLKERIKEELAEKIDLLDKQFQRKILKEEQMEKMEMEKLRDKKNILERLKASFERQKQSKEKKAMETIMKREKEFQKTKQDFVLQEELEKKRLNQKFDKEEGVLKKDKEKFKEIVRKKEKEFVLKKELEGKRFNEKINKEKINLQKAKQDFVLQKQEERKKIKDKLVNEFHDKVQREIDKKEKIIRQRLGNEFELKLKKKIQDHEADLNKRKIDLELEMQRNIKKVLSQ